MPSARAIRAGAAYVELYAVDNRLVRGLRRARQRLQAFSMVAQQIGARMLAVGGSVAGPLSLTIKAASDMEETMNKFNVVFGESASAIKQWGDTFAGQVGRSRQQVADFLAGTQDLLVPIGFEPGAATAMSKQLTQLAVDLASFNNKADADVLRDLHAALTGSSEVMKKYGVIVNETAVKQELLNRGLQPTKVSELQTVMARWQIILRGTTAAQGDAVRSAGSFANQMKALRARVHDAAVEIGSALLPVITPLVTRVAGAVQLVASWVRENQGLIVSLFKIGAALAAGGVALLLLGGAVSLVASSFGALAAVITGIGTAVGIVGAAIAALLSPLGLVLAGVAGLAGYLLTASEAGGAALAWLGERFAALRQTALAAFAGIGDALAAGDLSLAAKILWLTLKLEWQQGLNYLQAKWLEFQGFFVGVAQRAWFSLSGFLVDAWAGLQVAWVETTSYLSSTWTRFIGVLKRHWIRFGGFFRKVWARIKEAFGDSDAQAEIRRINQEVLREDSRIRTEQNQQLAAGEARRQTRRNEVEQQRAGTQDALEDEQRRRQAERETRHQAALRASEAALAEARREWQLALEEAATKRAAVDVDDGALPDRLAEFRQRFEQIAAPEGVLDQVQKRTIDVQGSFNATALRGLAAGGPADRTAKAVEGMNKKLGVLVREAKHGGLVFA